MPIDTYSVVLLKGVSYSNECYIPTNPPHTVNNYRQVTGMVTGENFAFFIYRHFVEII